MGRPSSLVPCINQAHAARGALAWQAQAHACVRKSCEGVHMRHTMWSACSSTREAKCFCCRLRAIACGVRGTGKGRGLAGGWGRGSSAEQGAAQRSSPCKQRQRAHRDGTRQGSKTVPQPKQRSPCARAARTWLSPAPQRRPPPAPPPSAAAAPAPARAAARPGAPEPPLSPSSPPPPPQQQQRCRRCRSHLRRPSLPWLLPPAAPPAFAGAAPRAGPVTRTPAACAARPAGTACRCRPPRHCPALPRPQLRQLPQRQPPGAPASPPPAQLCGQAKTRGNLAERPAQRQALRREPSDTLASIRSAWSGRDSALQPQAPPAGPWRRTARHPRRAPPAVPNCADTKSAESAARKWDTSNGGTAASAPADSWLAKRCRPRQARSASVALRSSHSCCRRRAYSRRASSTSSPSSSAGRGGG